MLTSSQNDHFHSVLEESLWPSVVVLLVDFTTPKIHPSPQLLVRVVQKILQSKENNILFPQIWEALHRVFKLHVTLVPKFFQEYAQASQQSLVQNLLQLFEFSRDACEWKSRRALQACRLILECLDRDFEVQGILK